MRLLKSDINPQLRFQNRSPIVKGGGGPITDTIRFGVPRKLICFCPATGLFCLCSL